MRVEVVKEVEVLHLRSHQDLSTAYLLTIWNLGPYCRDCRRHMAYQ